MLEQNTRVHSPIFVVGTGRSGSTIFFEMFSRHPHVAWLSRLSARSPRTLWRNRILMRARAYGVIDRLLGHRLGPSEAYPFWETYCPGFSNPYRDLVGGDVTIGAQTRIQAAIDKITNKRRHRFLAKITGWPRIRYLHRIFPDARFIEITRNPAAIVSSLLEVSFWDGWRGPTSWRRGPLPEDLAAVWRREGESFVALAAIEYLLFRRAMADCRATLPPGQYHRVDYAELCAGPVEVFKRVAEFCHLDWHAQFDRAIRRFELVDRDDQWRKKLSVEQQETLLNVLGDAGLSLDT